MVNAIQCDAYTATVSCTAQGRSSEEVDRKQQAVSSTMRAQQATAAGTRTRTDPSEMQPSGTTLELDAGANCELIDLSKLACSPYSEDCDTQLLFCLLHRFNQLF